MSRLLTDQPSYARTSGQGIGLNNVNKRLKRLFGEECGIRVNSCWGEGTQVLIKLPVSIFLYDRILDGDMSAREGAP